MDPNVTLTQIRMLIGAAHDADLTAVGQQNLAELFDELDKWLAKGGFLPTDWSRD